MTGIPYTARIPAFARDLAADEVVCRVSAPSTGVLLITRAQFGQSAGSALNENSGVAFVRLSSDGAGGVAMTFDEPIEAAAAFGGSGAAIDTDGWTTAPTVTGNNLFEGDFNVAGGWDWAPEHEGGYIVVPPSGRIGLRVLTSPSVSMTWRGYINLLYIGS